MQLGKNSKLTRHSNAVAAGTSTITPGSGIDMQNFESCLFMILWGAIVSGGVQSVEAHQSSDDGGSDAYTALLGSKVTVTDTDDNKITYVDVVKPRERYLKLIVNRATQNATVDGIIAIQYGPRKMPITQDSTVSGGETHVSPAEGTA